MIAARDVSLARNVVATESRSARDFTIHATELDAGLCHELRGHVVEYFALPDQLWKRFGQRVRKALNLTVRACDAARQFCHFERDRFEHGGVRSERLDPSIEREQVSRSVCPLDLFCRGLDLTYRLRNLGHRGSVRTNRVLKCLCVRSHVEPRDPLWLAAARCPLTSPKRRPGVRCGCEQ